MTILNMFKKELQAEAAITRKFFEILPEDKMDWQPHPKSMTLMRLTNHIAELGEWIEGIIKTKELDFEKEPYKPNDTGKRAKILSFFDECNNRGMQALDSANEAALYETWTLRDGEIIFAKTEKWQMIRHTLNQITHHRAQLGVYLRLLDMEVPGSYGGSADDDSF